MSSPGLRRNLQRRRLGGVCAGIADYLGVGPTPIRLLFLLSMFVSFSLSFWLYLALWWILPAQAHVPIPDVSRSLRRELKRLEKQVRKAHRRLDPAVADQVQDSFDAIKVLAPELDAVFTAMVPGSVCEVCLREFPELLERLLRLPAGGNIGGSLSAQLSALHDRLQQFAADALDRGIRAAGDNTGTSDSQGDAWKRRLDALHARLRDHAGEDTLSVLRRIEEKLAFLATRKVTDAPLFDFDAYQVDKIAGEYLPNAVEQYLKLPSAMARTQSLPGGKTAEQALNEQLDLLDHALLDLSRSLFQRNAADLTIHGRFLREKFAEQAFRLPE